MNATELRQTIDLEFADIHGFSYDLLRGEVRIDATYVYHLPTETWASAVIRFTGADYFRSIGAMRRVPPTESEILIAHETKLSAIGGERSVQDWGPDAGWQQVIAFERAWREARVLADEDDEHTVFLLDFLPAMVEILALDCEIELTPAPPPRRS